MSRMEEKPLVALLAAIIYAGADDCERSAGYTAQSAVAQAIAILDEVTRQLTPAHPR